MSMTTTGITLHDYLVLVERAFTEVYGEAEAQRKSHPEDLWVNLTAILYPLALGLAEGKKHSVWTQDAFTKWGEDPL